LTSDASPALPWVVGIEFLDAVRSVPDRNTTPGILTAMS
jgi:hypothetical protein